VFVPVFFVASGMRLDVNALFASTSAVARIALFLIALLIVRGLPALLYSRVIGRRRSIAAGLLQATSLTFIVAATQIGVELGVVTDTSAAALVAAGLVSVIVFPLLGLSLLGGSGQSSSGVALVAPTPSGAVPSVTHRRAVGRPRA
jgi:Kef-type K+ transport system membrane component KefB